MPEIVLSTLNAKFIHSAFGLRYLMANLGELQSRASMLEFDITQKPVEIVNALLEEEPRIIGLGIYIWNVALSAEVVSILKRIRPEIILILGGPEVSFETGEQAIARLADHVITGEADLKFAQVCRQHLAGTPPLEKIIHAEIPDLTQIRLPYDFYDDRDVARRVIYIEASRGCPFTCEFCLSSLDIPLRQFPIDALLQSLTDLLDRGVNQFKFVDRTFNLNLNFSRAILEFFLARLRPGLFLHFEMIPDRLPEGLRDLVSQFPPGALQFEVGIQSFNEEVCALIKRRQNVEKLTDNFRFLREHTGVHIHADLIAGLPGESLESFALGFDQLIALRPQEIQMGILKRLRGTPIVRHDASWEMVYSEHPPYEILQNKLIDFATMQRLRRFARYWDLLGNSGNFVETTPLLWNGGESPFWSFMRLSDWLFAVTGRKHGIALIELAELVFRHLTDELKQDRSRVALALWHDYQRGGRSDMPVFLRPFLPEAEGSLRKKMDSAIPKRQARHLASADAPTTRAAPTG